MASFKQLAIRGTVWTITGFGANYILRFASNLILTRLLIPEYFGLMAIVNSLLTGVQLFSDVGIGQSVVQNNRGDDPAFLNTAWTVQVIRGVLLWLVCLLITAPAASFYGYEQLLWLVPIMGSSSMILGFSSTSVYTLNRHMAIGKLTIFELVIQILSLVIVIAIAWYNRSIWAFVIGNIAAQIIRTIGTYLLIPNQWNRFAWDKEALKELFSFGKWMFVATAIMFLAEQSDRLILGKLISAGLLGVYSIAYTLASIPREVIKRFSYTIIFPAISRLADLPRSNLRAKILRYRQWILMVSAICIAALVTIGDLIIATLYNNRYEQATWMMPILCSGIWFSVLFYTSSPALLAINKPLYSAQSNFMRFLMIALGLPLFFSLSGTLGAMIVISFSDFPLYLVNLYGLWREQLNCLVQDLVSTTLFIGILVTFLFIRNSLGLGLPIQAIL